MCNIGSIVLLSVFLSVAFCETIAASSLKARRTSPIYGVKPRHCSYQNNVLSEICAVNLLWNINFLCFSLDAFILDSSENLNTESSESFWFFQGTEETSFASAVLGSIWSRHKSVWKLKVVGTTITITVPSLMLLAQSAQFRYLFTPHHELSTTLLKKDVEDEIHFLTLCPAYQEKRSTLFEYLNKEYRISVNRMAPDNVFLLLINPPSKNKPVQKLIAKYVFDCYEKRRSLVV